MKKKILKIAIIVISLLLIGYIIIAGINAYKFIRLESPVAVIKHSYKENGNANVEQYCSLGYELIFVRKGGNVNRYFNIGCNNIDKYSIDNSTKIVYESENKNICVSEKMKLYEDGERTYYLSCYDPNLIYYYDENDNKEKIVYALLHSHITLGDLRKAGYTITIESKNN